MATAFVYVFAMGSTLSLLSLAVPVDSRPDAWAIALTAAGGYALAGAFLAGFDRLPDWAFHAATAAGIALMATVIHSGGDLRPVYVLFLAWVPLYAAYFFGWVVGLAQSALAGIACGFALVPGSGTAGAYALVAIPLFVSPLALAVALRRRERGLAGELVAAQEELRNAQKLEAIGRLAGGVAHEFNNALTAIGGYAELLARELPEGRQRRDAQAIGTAIEHAAALTSRLLAVSGRQLLEPAPVDLNAKVRSLKPRLRRLCGELVELRLELDAGVGPVQADPARIEQMTLDLARNACDAMPDGGVLRIATSGALIPEGAAGPDGLPPGRYAILAVSDTGLGIAPEVREHVFEPFFSTKGGGPAAGLGLAVVQGIVRQSGGTVQVESAPGAGAVFRIWLPVAATAPAAEPPRPTAGSETEGAGSPTILVVEDDEGVRTLTRRCLEGAGYRVLEAGDGAAALELVRANPGAFALVLTDVVMPELDGAGLARAVVELASPPPILFMSGYTDRAFVEESLAGLGVGFVPKPFAIAGLTEAVAAAVSGRSAGTRT